MNPSKIRSWINPQAAPALSINKNPRLMRGFCDEELQKPLLYFYGVGQLVAPDAGAVSALAA